MNKTYSWPPIAQIHFSSVSLLFPLYLSHAWLTSGGLNQHWKWPVLLDLPLSASPPFLHLILSTRPPPRACQWWGLPHPLTLQTSAVGGFVYRMCAVINQSKEIACWMRSNAFEGFERKGRIAQILDILLFVYFFPYICFVLFIFFPVLWSFPGGMVV